MKNKKLEKLEEYYKKAYLIFTTIVIYLFISIFKNLYYGLYNISLKNLSNIEQQLATIVYQIFAISLSMTFLIKHKNDNEEELKKYIKSFLIGISTIVIYSLTSFLEILILMLTKTNIKNMSIAAKSIYLILFEILIMAIIALINNKLLKDKFKDFKKNWKKYFEKYLKYYILALIVMMISNFIIYSITQTIAGNEQTIENTLQQAPIYMFFSAVITAPFIEEMVFRQSIRNIIKDNLTFIIASGLIFGGLHVIGNINTIYDILYIIPYSAPGIAFAYILSKSDNIFVPMGIHFLHNGLLMTLQIILLLI